MTWTRSKFRTVSRRSVSFDTSTKPIRRFHGALLKSAGDDVENDRSGRLARAVSRWQRRRGRKSYGLLEKGLTSNERFDSAIISRAEPSRAEPSRAEPSRAEPSRSHDCASGAGATPPAIAA